MTFDQIITDLRNKIYHPVYFLMGEEPYYIDEISDYIEDNVLDEAEKGFNQTIVYGRDSELGQIVSMARRYPMMANYQVIIVKEAQDLFKKNDLDKIHQVIKARESLNSSRTKKIIQEIRQRGLGSPAEASRALGMEKANEKKLLEEIFSNLNLLNSKQGKAYAELVQLLDQPIKSTILVFNYKYQKLDKRKAFSKKLDKTGVLFESNRLYDNKIPDWIIAYLRKKGYGIEIPASALLAEYLGNSLSTVANELDKLCINLPEGTRVNNQHIEANIGISKDYNIFELQKAIGKGDHARAQKIANYFAANEKDNPAVKTIAILFSYFSKLLIYHDLKDRSPNNIAAALSVHPYFVRDYQAAANLYKRNRVERNIGILHAYDLKSKGINNNSVKDGELTRELIFRLMH